MIRGWIATVRAGGRVVAAGLAVVALLPIRARAQELLCCPPGPEIELGQCSNTRCQARQPGTIGLKVRDGCLVLEGVATDSCRATELTAERPPSKLFMILGLPASKGQSHLAVPIRDLGRVRVPLWAKCVEFRGTGMADAALGEPGEIPARVVVRPGQEVVISLKPEHLQTVTVDLRSESVQATRTLKGGPEGRLGSFPLGRYSLQAKADGFATFHDTVELGEPLAQLKLAYTLSKGVCLLVPIDQSNLPSPATVSANLEFLPSNEFPIPIRDGVVPVKDRDPLTKLPLARFCDLAPGRYRLALRARGVKDETREAELAAETRISTVVLVAAATGQVAVQGEDGGPIEGVDATFGWSSPDGSRAVVRRRSRPDGTVELPGVVPPVVGTLRLEREGFETLAVSASSADRLVEVLKKAGELTGRLDEESCGRKGVSFAAEVRADWGPNGYAPFAQGTPRDCAFKVAITESNEYRVRVTALDALPFEKVVKLENNARHDLGLIHLDEGAPLTVIVTAHDRPVVGAAVTLPAQSVTSTTDDSGVTDFRCLPDTPDPVAIRVDHPDYGAVLRQEPPGLDRTVRIDLPAPARIFGRVVGDKGVPEAGTTVLALGPDVTMRTSITDPSGSYHFVGLGPGRWQVSLQRRGDDAGILVTRIGATRIVQLGEGDEQQVDFLPSFEVSARISGAPITSGRIAIAALSEAGYSNTIVTDDPTGFSTTLPASGRWQFVIRNAVALAEVRPPCPCVLDLVFGRPSP